ncbi:MAG: hypothetical protein IT531_16400 [Burkholderiales bacterium]|nr:hypothetical protein [Burkholderiales bacterium]
MSTFKIRSIVVAGLIAASPLATATEEVSGGFQSANEISAVAASGERVTHANVPRFDGTEATGFQSSADISAHARTMASMSESAPFHLSSGDSSSSMGSSTDTYDGRAM